MVSTPLLPVMVASLVQDDGLKASAYVLGTTLKCIFNVVYSEADLWCEINAGYKTSVLKAVPPVTYVN